MSNQDQRPRRRAREPARYGRDVRRDRERAAPDVLREPLGRVAFANSQLNGHQHYRIAMEEGRAVRQVIKGV